ncbi:hypothetical protein [Siphonobacter sp. SORGH_AS_0500]|uniref:hypothetical protein n=1 Tax=Siphonobacter sp. SORGH_AS_0500 TaxID=1864824 RepID=UPI00285B293A|nr:hypothetical protein [Siphonobacter sp. SORGH_AS_0500]MDR6195719.1 hypothetical protein [Siphonobacter sp. SORGH_AS_0500]
MDSFAATASGVVGATTLTLLHETARKTVDDAPRIDLLGKRAISKLLPDYLSPSEDTLHKASLVGDIMSNAAYYGLVSMDKPKNGLRNGAILGLAAGIGAVLLPGPLGLGEAPSNRTTATKLMTIGWYLAGGLAAGLTFKLLKR